MKRFEVEFEKDVYWIVSFERLKIKDVFSYKGDVHVSPNRTAESQRIPVFFSFQFTRTETGWTDIGQIELISPAAEASHLLDVINDLLIQRIKEFEGG